MSDLLERLGAACVGHPHAKIAWPHYLLHDAMDAIRERDAEIERLRYRVSEENRKLIFLNIESAVNKLEIERLRNDVRDLLLIVDRVGVGSGVLFDGNHGKLRSPRKIVDAIVSRAVEWPQHEAAERAVEGDGKENGR